MDRQHLIDRARKIMAEEFEVDIDRITDEAPLAETLDLDSLDIVDMVVLVEEHFGFKMTKEDLSCIRSFSDFYDVLERKSVK